MLPIIFSRISQIRIQPLIFTFPVQVLNPKKQLLTYYNILDNLLNFKYEPIQSSCQAIKLAKPFLSFNLHCAS